MAGLRRCLSEGADPDRIHGHYLARALSALENAELYTVLASTGDEDAIAAIEGVISELDALHEELDREFPNPELT